MEEEEEVTRCCCCTEVHLSGAIGEGGVDEAGAEGKGEALRAIGGAAVDHDDLQVGIVDFEAVLFGGDVWFVLFRGVGREEGRREGLGRGGGGGGGGSVGGRDAAAAA